MGELYISQHYLKKAISKITEIGLSNEDITEL